MRPVYLDNNATTRVDPDVVAAMLPYFTEHYGNPSSAHDLGVAARRALKRARGSVRALIGAGSDDEIQFTSGGTESDNTAILGALGAADGRDEVVVSAVEHPAILALVAQLANSGRIKAHVIPVDQAGRLDRARYRAALSARVALVSIMWANNETGVLFPVEELAEEAKAVGALFHSDAIQAAGRIPIEVRQTSIDLISLSAHKLHGPKGVGALYVRLGLTLNPMIYGGRQERGRRAGTENLPGVVGFARAAEIAHAALASDAARMRVLRDRLERSLQDRIPEAFVVGRTEPRLPNTSALVCGGAEADAIALMLNRAGIAVSTGAACAAGSFASSHVLRAMNIPAALAQGATRFSLSRDNCDDDVDRVLAAMPSIVERLRGRPRAELSAAPQLVAAVA
jgi:cysteine desulfurase